MNADPYEDVHRVLLQYFLLRKSFPEDELLEKFNILMAQFSSHHSEGDTYSVETLTDAIDVINSRMQKYCMEMMINSRMFYEGDAKRHWTLVNTRDDEISRYSGTTGFKDWQLLLIRNIFEQMVSNEDACISRTEIMDLGRSLVAGKSSEIKHFIATLLQEDWIEEENRNNFFIAGSRALQELGSVFEALGAERDPVTSTISLTTRNYQKFRKRLIN